MQKFDVVLCVFGETIKTQIQDKSTRQKKGREGEGEIIKKNEKKRSEKKGKKRKE